MANLRLGEHSKITALPSERQRIRAFWGNTLGCRAARISDPLDVFHLGPDFHIGIVYEDSALSEADALKAIWLELQTDRLEELKKKILQAGIKRLDYWDIDNFYFQAPGGQVFRLVSADKNMSAGQR